MLRQRLSAAYTSALQSGSLKPIETTFESVSSPIAPSLEFAIRVVKNLARKDKSAKQQQPDPTKSAGDGKLRFNPFLPYERDMFVQDAAPRHVVLLNKFPVVDEHLLIVTREYEEQNSLLTADDFAALWTVLRELDGVGFYNAGRISGASQHHKHLQVVAGALAPGLAPGRVPFDALFDGRVRAGELYTAAQLPFAHFAVDVADCMADECAIAMNKYMTRYTQMLNEAMKKIDGIRSSEGGTQPFPYNLLVTRRWMLLVPRREECYRGISVNSLGFAGCLLVRDHQQLELIKADGPMKVLQHTAFGSFDSCDGPVDGQ